MFSYFKSKTNWLLIAMFLITYAPVVKNILPENWKWAVDAILSVAAIYTHTHPSQSYSGSTLNNPS